MILDSFSLMGVFARAAKGRMDGSRSGKVSKEAPSAIGIRIVPVIINKASEGAEGLRAAQSATGLAEDGGRPCFWHQ